MTFNIRPRELVFFRMIVESRIVVPQQSLPHNDTLLTRIHDLISNTICQTTSCHSTSKSISDKEDTLKSYMAFDITPCGPNFRVVVESRIVVPQHPSINSKFLLQPLQQFLAYIILAFNLNLFITFNIFEIFFQNQLDIIELLLGSSPNN